MTQQTARPGLAERLLTNSSGLAFTEFAMTLPILCTLCITGVEVASFVNACMNVSQIALSVADNSGRIQGSIDETDVDSIMIGARIAGQSVTFGPNGRVILSMIEVNGLTGANAGQKITWQRCFGQKNVASSYGVQGDGATDNSRATGFGPPGRRIVAETGAGVMFVEVVYDYRPVFPINGWMVDSLRSKTLRYTAAFPVRERNNNAIANGFNLPDDQKRLCTRFSAT